MAEESAVKRFCLVGTESEHSQVHRVHTKSSSHVGKNEANAAIEAAISERFPNQRPSFWITFHLMDKLPDFKEENEVPLFMIVFANVTPKEDEAMLDTLLQAILSKLAVLFGIDDLGSDRLRDYKTIRDHRIQWILESGERPTRQFAVTNVVLKKGVNLMKHFGRLISEDGPHVSFDPIRVDKKYQTNKVSRVDEYILLFEYSNTVASRSAFSKWIKRKNLLGQFCQAFYLPEGRFRLDFTQKADGIGKIAWQERMDSLHEIVLVAGFHLTGDVFHHPGTKSTECNFNDILRGIPYVLGVPPAGVCVRENHEKYRHNNLKFFVHSFRI